MEKDGGEEEDGDLVAIGAVLGGVMVATVFAVGIFMSDQAWVLAPIAGALAAMGIALGYFQSKM